MQWRNHLFDSRARGTDLLEFTGTTCSPDPICMEFKSCVLRLVREVDVSMSHGGRDECGMPSVPGPQAWVAVVSDAYRCLRGGVGLTSSSIKRNLNISKDVRYGR